MAPLFACLQPLPSLCTVGGITTVQTDCGALASSPSSYRKILAECKPHLSSEGGCLAALRVHPMPSHPGPPPEPQAPEVEATSVRCWLVPSRHLFVNRSTDGRTDRPGVRASVQCRPRKDKGEREREREGEGEGEGEPERDESEEQLETIILAQRLFAGPRLGTWGWQL